MTIEDYDQVYHLWKTIHGFGIRSIDDSREGVERFLKRNPTTSVVAVSYTHLDVYKRQIYMMQLMDSMRNAWGIRFPFEK